MVTASGISILSIGSAFWGVLLGSVVYTLQELLRARRGQSEEAAAKKTE
jgi:benzoate membrane transport protein